MPSRAFARTRCASRNRDSADSSALSKAVVARAERELGRARPVPGARDARLHRLRRVASPRSRDCSCRTSTTCGCSGRRSARGSDRALAYLDRVARSRLSGVTSHETPGRRTLFHDLGASIGARGVRRRSIAKLVAAVTARPAPPTPGGRRRCSRDWPIACGITIGAALEGVRPSCWR